MLYLILGILVAAVPKASFLVNAESLWQKDANQNRCTYIIFGNPRGGTTMVANLLRLLGVYLGDDLPVNLENNDFNWDVLKRANDEKSPDHLKSLIKDSIIRYNGSHSIWGWKYPLASVYMQDIIEHVNNPRLICVFRDLVSTSSRSVHRQNVNTFKAMKHHNRIQAKNLSVIEELACPSLMVSYEKAISYPNVLVEDICELMRLSIDSKRILEISKGINPELGYRNSRK